MMKKTNFEITTVSWHEVEGKIDDVLLEDTLNEHLSLSDYGSGIEKIFFVFVSVQPDNNLHQNEVQYDSVNKKISLKLNLSYPHLKTANKNDVSKMMASLFLKSIDLYEELEIPEFAKGKFYNDVENLFFRKGWLVFQE